MQVFDQCQLRVDVQWLQTYNFHRRELSTEGIRQNLNRMMPWLRQVHWYSELQITINQSQTLENDINVLTDTWLEKSQ